MYLRDALSVMHERPMLVGPLENRAFEILHVRVTGGPQPSRRFTPER